MRHMLTLVINEQIVLQYDKNNRLPGHQRRFLERMDDDMNRGIVLGAESLEHPDREQRTRYVAMKLVQAALNDNENLKMAACAYLGDRSPELVKIIAEESDENVSMQLVYQQDS